MTKIIVPSLGESVSEATIKKWYKNQGEAIKIDEILLEIETEKVTLEVNSPATGVLSAILKQQDDVVSVGEVIGQITEGIVESLVSKQDINNVLSASLPDTKSTNISTDILSPAVRKLVAENNLDPRNIIGSGKDERITKEDVLKILTQPLQQLANKNPVSVSESTDSRPIERRKMSRLRKTIAQRLKDSQNTAAILTTFNEIDMTNVMAIRQKYREEFEKKKGIKLGLMSFFVKAAVEALKSIPAVNASIEGDDIIYKYYYDIGVAVGTEQGLVVPVVRDSDKLSFSDIESEIVNLSKKAREGRLSMAELSGGTFSISNGGIYGSLLSTPIINPPQSAILGLHKTQERPMAVAGKVEIRPMMYMALSYDHRIIDGKEAVTFLVKIKEAIENPERLLLGL